MVTCKKTSFVLLTVIFGTLTLASGTALAVPSYMNSFNSNYGTSGTALDSCSLCHTSVPNLNGYGDDYAADYNYTNIEGLDSDGDGFVNLDEIQARTFPGSSSSFPATLPTCTDNDGDGFAVEGGNCGTVDCNDSNPAIYPGAQESCTDSIDNNCNGLIDNQDPQAVNCPPVCTDLDGDGYAIEGGNCGQVDCNDNTPLVNPGAAENCSDNIDNNCDSLVDVMDPNAVDCPTSPPPAPTCTDNDTDGFAVEGGDCGLVDCNDADPAIHPDAIEVCTDSVDNNCDGLVNFADPNAVGCPVGCTDLDLDGYAVDGGDCGPVDCNDQDEFINPSAAEECSDGIDNNCNDLIDIADPNVVNCPVECTDIDGDGYAVNGDACGQIDCSDSDPSLNPGATEICGDGIDQNCDGSDLSCASVLLPPTISINVSGVHVSINWSTVSGATGYKLSYAPYPYTGPQSIVSVDVGQTTSASFDLWHGAAFNVAVQAYNADGSSNFSNIEYFTIESTDDDGDDDGDDDAVPVAPTISLTVTGLNVSISWSAVADATGYTIFYAPNPYLGPQSINSADLGNETSFSYELWAGASYTVAVQAYNDHGNSGYSNIEVFVIEASVEEPVHIDGAQLYATNCSSCHGSLNTSNVAGEDFVDIEEAIEGNEGGMGFLSFLNQDELNAVTEVLASSTPATGDRTGQNVYDDNCAGCHLINGYDATGNIDLARKGRTASTKLASGHGGTVSATEIVNVSNWLDTFTAGEPGSGSCTSCHGQPPSGNSSPNRAGAHGVHTALNGLADNCATCHSPGASHNETIDLGLNSSWNTKSGSAVANSNGTCSSVSCHGGATTPNWQSGSINVDSQCTSCHSYGTAQYNGYSSGKHRKHVDSERIACTTCHDVNLLRNGHFTNLTTQAFEQDPAASIKNSLGYGGGSCSTASCHGRESWND